MAWAQLAMAVAGLGMDAFQSSRNRNAARSAASGANAADQAAAAQVDALIDRLMMQAGGLNDEADFNREEGNDLARLFARAIQSQEGNQSYLINRNQMNDALSLDQRDYLRRIDGMNYDDTGFVRDATFSRQAMEDAAARDRRLFELGEIEGFQGQREGEYNERYARLMADRRQAQMERDYDIRRQEQILERTNQLREGLSRVMAEQGDILPPDLLGRPAIEEEASKRSRIYTEAIDKLSDRALSMNEAGLMRRGVDHGNSADANEARAEVAARLAPQYREAMVRAGDDAAAYIDALNKPEMDRYEGAKDLRSRIIQEAQARYGAGLELEAGLNPLRSSVMDRDIGSAIYDRLPTELGLAEFFGVPSRQFTGSEYSGVNPDFQDPGFLDPQVFGALSSYARGRSIDARNAANSGLGSALEGAFGQRRVTASGAEAAAGALGTARAQNDQSWRNIADWGLGQISGRLGGTGSSATSGSRSTTTPWSSTGPGRLGGAGANDPRRT